MNKRELEKLFVYVQGNVEKKYEEECSMAMDCFIEEGWLCGIIGIHEFEFVEENYGKK